MDATEICKALFARYGEMHCPVCGLTLGAGSIYENSFQNLTFSKTHSASPLLVQCSRCGKVVDAEWGMKGCSILDGDS